ncbi:MAG: hypothetical protein ACKPKO_49125, partial [Candidatus Fonsibacter sp.]
MNMTNFRFCDVTWALYTTRTQRTKAVGTIGTPIKGSNIGQTASGGQPSGKWCNVGAYVMQTAFALELHVTHQTPCQRVQHFPQPWAVRP